MTTLYVCMENCLHSMLIWSNDERNEGGNSWPALPSVGGSVQMELAKES